MPTMTKATATATRKTAKKPRKRGPKEERLVITEDPAAALQRLLKPTKKR